MSFPRTAAGLVAFLCLGAGVALGSGSSREITSLVGVRTLKVVAEQVPDEAERLGITTNLLIADAETQLRQAGAPLVHPANADDEPRFVYVRLSMLRINWGYTFSVHTGFYQPINIPRDGGESGIRSVAETWEEETLGVSGNESPAKLIEAAISNHIKCFANDLAKANTPPPGEPRGELQLGQQERQAENPAAIWLQLEKTYPGVDVREEWRKAIEAATAEHGAENPKLRELADRRFRDRCEALKKDAGEKAKR